MAIGVRTVFDRSLVDAAAPMGSWFNANYYRNAPISITPYPENVTGAGTVPGLAFNVKNLLGQVDKANPWQLFAVSDEQRGHRQIKYAMCKTDDACFEWLCSNFEPVAGNADKHIELFADEDEYGWRAIDADPQEILISIFLVNEDDMNLRIPMTCARVYQIRK